MSDRSTYPEHACGTPPSTAKALCDFVSKSLEHALTTAPYALLDWPYHDNVGDHAIWLGAQRILQDRLKLTCAYAGTCSPVDIDVVRALPPETAIILNGGGNFGDLWPRHEVDRERIIATFTDRRIVILPQTLYFRSSAALTEAARVVGSHPDIHIFARDQTSFDLGRQTFGAARLHFAPDMAFGLYDILSRIPSELGIQPVVEWLHLCRNEKDAEYAPAPVPIPNPNRAEDWTSLHSGVPEHRADEDVMAARLGLTHLMDCPKSLISWRYIVRGCGQLLSGKRVITNRLHAHILALLMGKQNVLLRNSYYKNQAFFESWTAGFDGVSYEIIPGDAGPAGLATLIHEASRSYGSASDGGLKYGADGLAEAIR